MSLLSTSTKAKIGAKSAKAMAKRPGTLLSGARATARAGKTGLTVARPVLKRRTRKRVDRLGETARTVGTALAVYGPIAAYELGIAEPPKPKRTAPRVAAGIVIGAGAMYFLEPEHGHEHREKVAELVS